MKFIKLLDAYLDIKSELLKIQKEEGRNPALLFAIEAKADVAADKLNKFMEARTLNHEN